MRVAERTPSAPMRMSAGAWVVSEKWRVSAGSSADGDVRSELAWV